MNDNWANGPWHLLAVCALVRNHANQVILIHHNKRGWDIPGGQVEQGEDLLAALKREVLEETGVSISNPQLAVIYSNLQPENKSYGRIPPKVIHCYIAQYAGGALQTSPENSQTLWLTAEQAYQRIQDQLLRDRLQDLLHFDGKIRYVTYLKQPYCRLMQTFF